MAHYGIDLATHDAQKFDSAFWAFVGSELSDQANIEARLHSYQVHATLHRRVVEISDATKLTAFASYWRQTASA